MASSSQSALLEGGPAHPILDTAARVVKKARHVSINQNELDKLSKELAKNFDTFIPDHTSHWLDAAPPVSRRYFDELPVEKQIVFLVIFHSIGFCYWGEPKWTVSSPNNDTKYDGAMALLISLTSNPSFLDIKHMQRLSQLQFKQMLAGFKSDHIDALPLLNERHQFILQLAPILLDEKRMRVFRTPTLTALQSAIALSSELPGFRDVAIYDGEEIMFLKRAQLLITDINYTLVRSVSPAYSCMHELTGFADYKLPQLLRHHRVVKYDAALSEHIDAYLEIDSGSAQEVEIRAAALVTVELLKRRLAEQGILTTASEIDSRLWLLAQKLDKKTVKPYHRCRTVFY